MASGSRSSDPVDRIWCGLGFILFSAKLWWRELMQEGMNFSGISDNKVDFWSFAVLVVWRAAGKLFWSFSYMLPWWKRLGEAFGTSSQNKRIHLQSYSLGAWLFFLAGLGGEGEEENNLVLAGSTRWRGNPSAAAESSTMVVRCRPSIHVDGRQLLTPLMRRLFNLLVRPLSYGSTTAFLFASIPSGMFPGDGGDGRRAIPSFKRVGDDQGSDCIFRCISKVLCAKFQENVVFFHFLEVLFVICISTASY
jgi:hypothetical protein